MTFYGWIVSKILAVLHTYGGGRYNHGKIHMQIQLFNRSHKYCDTFTMRIVGFPA
jgi:hypothetical protein